MGDERMRILDMVREGKISADEAVRLLEALKGVSAGGAGSDGGGSGGSGGARRGDDPVGSFVGAVTDAVTDALGSRGWRGWGGGWSWGGDWHGGGGSLRGLERKAQREADGWQVGTFSDGDRGGFDLPEGAKLRIESEGGAIYAKVVDGPPRLDLEGDDFYNFGTYVARKDDEVVVAAHRTEPHARMPRLVVSVPGHVGRLSVETSGGGVEAAGFRCPTALKTAGGGIRVRDHGQGELEARTAGGGIDVVGTPRTLEAHTAGGSVRFKGETGALDAKTAGGSINVDGVRLTSGAHRAKTAGGSVNVRLTRDSSVAIEAATSAGHINVDLPGAQGEHSGSRIAPRYQGQYNGSGASLELRTVGGSINVSLAQEAQESATAAA